VTDNSSLYQMLSTLSMGRGRHAPMAWLLDDGGVKVTRSGQVETAFSVDVVSFLHDVGFVRFIGKGPYRRAIITPAGRKRVAAGIDGDEE
jgi:hypothetical protein